MLERLLGRCLRVTGRRLLQQEACFTPGVYRQHEAVGSACHLWPAAPSVVDPAAGLAPGAVSCRLGASPALPRRLWEPGRPASATLLCWSSQPALLSAHRCFSSCCGAGSVPWPRRHSSVSRAVPPACPSPHPPQPGRRGLAQNHVTAEQSRVIRQLRVSPEGVRATVQQLTKHENIYTVPNGLCVARIVLTPLIGWLVIHQLYTPALIGFCLAGGTDMLDGWIARKFPSQASRLGSFLDPLADKLLMATLVVSLTCSQLLPWALTLLIVGRDLGLIAAASWVRYKSVPPPVTVARYFDVTYATAQLEPTTISKVNTCIQLALVASTLAAPVFGFVDHTALHILWCVTAGTTVTSGLIYALLKEDTFKLMRHAR